MNLRVTFSAITSIVLAIILSPANGQSIQQANNLAAQNRVVSAIVRELNNDIPGDYAEGSAEAEKLKQIAIAYFKRDQATVDTLLSELSAADPDVPPTAILLADMAFITNNTNASAAVLERGVIADQTHPAFPLAFSRRAFLQNRLYECIAMNEKTMSLIDASNLSEAAKRFYQTESVYLMTAAEIRRGRFDVALQFATEWEKLDPQADRMFLANAEIRFKQQDVETAISYLNRRSAKVQADVPTEIVIGKWYQGIGDVENYTQWVADGYKKNPDSKLSQIEYAALLLRREEFDQALSLVDQYEQAHGASPDSRLIRGRVAFSNQDYESARAAFSTSLRQQPNNFDVVYLNVLAMLESEDKAVQQQALPLAQRASRLFPNNQLAIAVLGWALVKTGNPDAGSGLIQRAARVGNMLPDTGYFLATALAMQERNLEALQILEPIIGTADIFLFRAQAKQLLDSIKAADRLPNPDN